MVYLGSGKDKGFLGIEGWCNAVQEPEFVRLSCLKDGLSGSRKVFKGYLVLKAGVMQFKNLNLLDFLV